MDVAERAGLPEACVQRAREVLAALERGSNGRPPIRPPADVPVEQMPLLPERSRLLDELGELDVDALTPLEAINKLYELRKRAREDGT